MNYKITHGDEKVIEIYKDFLPLKLFDSHVHLYSSKTVPTSYNSKGVFCKEVCTADDYKRDLQRFYPGVEEIRINAIPMPEKGMFYRENGLRDLSNSYIKEQVSHNCKNVGSVYVLADDTEERISEMLSDPGVAALKCYCYSAGNVEYEKCEIGDYLSESAWHAANTFGIPIILHMMRPEALADEHNFQYITSMTRKYQNAKLILAHCARSYASWTIAKKIRQLEDAGNIWFDLAAVTDPTPMMACIIKNAGKRVLWGTDYPICMKRSKCISLGKEWKYLTEKDQLFIENPNACLMIGESLLAFWQAAMILDLDQTQIEDIFYNNAVSCFNLS